MNRRKVNDSVLSQMLSEGKTQAEIAAYFKVSRAAICKKLKRLQSLNPPESFRQLTQKEQSFALALAQGKSQTKAALDAFECSSLKSAKALGSEVANRGDVRQAVNDLLEAKGLGREYRFQKLKSFVEHSDVGVGLAALREACKIGDDYPAQKNMNMNLTANISVVDMSKYIIKYDDNGNKIDD